jgi:ParB family chromosome partitioning protein
VATVSDREALHSSESTEWYTPARYIEAARDVLGGIDLDPASCPEANETVRAGRFFTREDDGLSREWHGRLWINPPYGRHPETNESQQAIWSRKLRHEYESGRVQAAILLVNAVPDRSWFEPLWSRPICFTTSRIQFESPGEGNPSQPTHGSAFVYFGDNEHRFRDRFAEFGPVVTEVYRRDDEPEQRDMLKEVAR